ncbi:Anaerobic glycerol-3-phosphate dehydrogenase subunit C [Aquisphaera giovannonii]|uniref:Anaerobic glycerol-3-phosphate dehydrogenase subunit C n=1 Tax=Aquisphaera giovannonii TaxID=406548 RepID=A0A5B9W6J1_9BACT|nr:FAD-binding and (Fe-S)-binding domain-containing protein [Aquisphaera giovannonii]QEH35779.1 Anaerobic glycerol-3-phosphate dehydrogenase subunit C [Aquisphaera giovannonii]
MDERRARIFDDLRGVLDGELEFEPSARASYAFGASLYEVEPLGVVAPRTEHDVVAVVRYAAEHRLPLHARGAATDSGGGALGPGLVIDFSRHLRKVVHDAGDHVVVEPGITPDALNAHLAPLGRRVEPVPVNAAVGTVGGMIAVDAAGERSPRFGSMADQVERLRVVFAQGETADVGFSPWPSSDDDATTLADSIVRKLHNIRRMALRRPAPPSAALPRNRAGYALSRACTDDGIDLARLICGSEGTLALVLQAALRTVPLPGAQGVALLPFGRIADAADAARRCLEAGLAPSACDLYDWRLLSLARDVDPALHSWIPEAARSALVVEFEADSADEVAGALRRLAGRLARDGRFVGEPATATRRADCERLVGLRRLAEPLLMKAGAAARPISAMDDVAVPPEQLGPVIARFQEVMKRLGIMWTLSAGAADGRIRLRPFLDPADPGDRSRIEPLAAELYEIVLEAGGTVSASSGCGLARTQFLPRQYGDLVQTFRDIKDAFDPAGLLNPGKVIGDDPHQMSRDLKRFPAAAPAAAADSVLLAAAGSGTHRVVPAEGRAEAPTPGPEVILPVLRWPEPGAVGIASACHGCGACRGLEPAMRMCPSYRAHRREEATPRSQANLLRQVASGAADPKLWGSEESRQLASLCIHCKLCKTECPAEIDVSGLMLEAKAAYVELHGLPPGDWVFSRLEMWARLASRFPILSNFLLSRRSARWVIERLLGVSRHRVLPPVRRTPFTRRAARMGLTKARPHEPGPRAAYFVDVYANYYDHELAEAVVDVLRRAEVNVFVPPRQRSSGMAPLIVGDVDYARDLAVSNLRVLGNAVRDGYTIVCSEPTAALMIRHEYVKLTGDLDAELVAQNTMDLGQYLRGLDARGQLPTPSDPLHARVGYHQPCHLRALGVGTPGLELIRKIPELDVEFIDRGCSGMGGTYGLARGQFRTSLRAGRQLVRRLRDDDIEIGSTECGACRIQMEQGQTKRTLHPIKLLSLAYGLNPSLRRHFKDPKPRHVMF